MTNTIKISRELLERLYEASGRGDGMHTDDLRAVRALLSTPPADAADMGGQAGEEVEVVAHLMRPDFMEPYVSIRRGCSGVFVEQLMTVAQHHRILAQRDAAIEEWSGTAVQNGMESDRLAEELAKHRQQAGKLVEALRSCTRAKSAAEVGIIVDEALAAWEKSAPASTQRP